MKTILNILFLIITIGLNAQPSLQESQTLALVSDTIYWEIPELKLTGISLFSKMDSVDIWNNDFNKDKKFHFLLKSGKTIVTCASPSKEENHIYPVKIVFGKQEKRVEVYFWKEASVHFDANYISQNSGKHYIEIPPVFELANIVFALTDAGAEDDNLVEKRTKYHKEVMKYFGKWKQHPLLQKINPLMNEDAYSTYYDYRMDSYGYDLVNGKIIPSKIYTNLGRRTSIQNDKNLWEQFVKDSHFEEFYKQHTAYYQTQISKTQQYLALSHNWQWLEARFPNRYNCYKVVMSPLINGFHNTQNYEDNGFKECLMIVCDAQGLEKIPNKKIISGIYTGIVFTEIDHNYVNPISDMFINDINPIFSDRKKWTSEAGDATHYTNPYTVFNEYMTHAIYLVYIHDNYKKWQYNIIKKRRVALMNRRGFKQFELFNNQLLSLYNQQKEKNFVKLYPAMLDWAKHSN